MGALFSILFDPLVGAYDSLQIGDPQGCRKELRLCRRRVEILMDRVAKSDLDSSLIASDLQEMETSLRIADDALKSGKYEDACDAMNDCAKMFDPDSNSFGSLSHVVLKLDEKFQTENEDIVM
jgi:hypothetical protein